jgi:hypothetical protein
MDVREMQYSIRKNQKKKNLLGGAGADAGLFFSESI